jgi:DNA-binding transcriptional ArsR family regulator
MDLGFIPSKDTKIRFSLEPAYNAACSLTLLSEDVGGIDDWVNQTAAQFSPEERRTNELLVSVLHTQLDGREWPSFPALVDDLASRTPEQIKAQFLDGVIEFIGKPHDATGGDIDWPHILSDRDRFIALYQQVMQAKGEMVDCEDWCNAFFDLLQRDAADLQADLVDYLRCMWDTYLAAEWEHRLPLLRESIAAFESLDLSTLTTGEAVRRIIGRDEPQEWRNWRDGLDEIIFIPSPHIGPYVLLINHTETSARIVFGARIPEGAAVRSSTLSRSDLFNRLEALADDTRLRILEFVALEGEQGAKDIMDRFDLSKSAASRHLRQLTANGYLIVRQQDVSKYYRLNPNRIDEAWRMLKAFLQLP